MASEALPNAAFGSILVAGATPRTSSFWSNPNFRKWRQAGVAQLSRDLGVSLARSGVRVNALAFGPIETPQLTAMFDQIGPEQARLRFTHRPMGRFGTLGELAATVAYLASDDAGFVTASIFPSPASAAPGAAAAKLLRIALAPCFVAGRRREDFV